MKKLTFVLALAIVVFCLASCSKVSNKSFVGTWGVERIDYYNIDYAGNPIEATVKTYEFTPGDPKSGIDLVFRDDRTGEMRDRSRDTLYIDHVNGNDTVTEVIICPDTTLVTKFSYSFDASESILFMTMENMRIFGLRIENFEKDSFIYFNEYDEDYVEKAYMRRVSKETRSSGSKSKPTFVPRHKGSILSDY